MPVEQLHAHLALAAQSSSPDHVAASLQLARQLRAPRESELAERLDQGQAVDPLEV